MSRERDRRTTAVRRSESTGRSRRAGFALVAALALLVVLGSTGAVMIRLTGLQQAGASLAILGARGDWAARSGIAWGVHEARRVGGCPAASTVLSLSEGALSGFDVTVHCSATRHTEGSRDRTSLRLVSEARFGAVGSISHVYREMSAAVVF